MENTFHYALHPVTPVQVSGGTSDRTHCKKQIIIELIEYIPHAVVSKTVIEKNTDNITISSFSEGVELIEKNAPFDTYIQIIEGIAELSINNRDYMLHMGNGIIIPAHSKHHFNGNVKFKMLSTVIRSDCD